MKLPKEKKRFCKHCKKSTAHKVGLVKSKGRSATHPLSRGSTKRIKGRGDKTGYGNFGKYSKPAISKFKRTGAKISKKVVLKYTCNDCKKSSQASNTFRAKRTVFE